MRILNFAPVASVLSTMLIAIALASAALDQRGPRPIRSGIDPAEYCSELIGSWPRPPPAPRRCFDRLVRRLWGGDADLFLIDQAVISAVAWSQTQAEPREAS